ncbi:hypothetical protein WH47_06503 [Habropoda laboriosa]|uniref:Uncharacterized protein n=1 Tax=Habropoda laboriosa TaxID=597456 RepID=A0A0L7RD82_9HYME|nr:hypothetical protein WH47_06503 [Habropoda laboriosa]
MQVESGTQWREGTEMTKQEATDEREDLAMPPDECDSSCPRRISQSNRMRKLEERQRIIDEYLLYKNSGYFEDVCTCSLSCVIRTLKDDSFARSTLLSAALFALGLKLCSELSAWYLPIRFS